MASAILVLSSTIFGYLLYLVIFSIELINPILSFSLAILKTISLAFSFTFYNELYKNNCVIWI